MKKHIYEILALVITISPIVWDIVNSDHKELTIEECKKTSIDSLYDGQLSVYYLDSIKLDNKYSIIEYRIINTGNSTIFGYGDWSDILTESNKLPIIDKQADLRFIQLAYNNIAELDDQNRLAFKQWKPKESIDITCLAANDNIINISDRDIKDVRILHKKTDSKITNFEKLSMSTKWSQVIFFLLTLIELTIFLIIVFRDIIKAANPRFKKRMAISLTIMLISALYIFSLPLRWLL
ncbi:hypothetical protein [uncultured Alistipes sp.]|uniref:hypothetical protein n=1 Tax=uncultured Alistipes sp. TaxID=538949 RepID=UPI002599079B|nr:hypothetical protein [uncultured Alistipes sp.]